MSFSSIHLSKYSSDDSISDVDIRRSRATTVDYDSDSGYGHFVDSNSSDACLSEYSSRESSPVPCTQLMARELGTSKSEMGLISNRSGSIGGGRSRSYSIMTGKNYVEYNSSCKSYNDVCEANCTTLINPQCVWFTGYSAEAQQQADCYVRSSTPPTPPIASPLISHTFRQRYSQCTLPPRYPTNLPRRQWSRLRNCIHLNGEFVTDSDHTMPDISVKVSSASLGDSSNCSVLVQSRRLPCRTFLSAGTCSYGDRCHFLHDPRCASVHKYQLNPILAFSSDKNSLSGNQCSRSKNKIAIESNAQDAFYWAPMLIVSKSESVMKCYETPPLRDHEANKHHPYAVREYKTALAVHSMWAHFLAMLQQQQRQDHGDCTEDRITLLNETGSDCKMNIYTGRPRLSVFVQLSNAI